jgi:hypothetical protein
MQNRAPWFECQKCRQDSSAIVPLVPSFRRCIKGLLFDVIEASLNFSDSERRVSEEPRSRRSSLRWRCRVLC